MSINFQKFVNIKNVGCTLLLLSLVGCGNSSVTKPDHIPDLTPCTITLTYNGQPVEGATVIAASQGGKYSAAGTTDAAGVAVMKTDALYDGVVPGDFKVSVTKRTQTDAPEVDLDAPEPEPEELGLAETPVFFEYLVPEKYASLGTAGLKFSVSEGTPHEETFDLVD
ncbi:MAG: carboxypeptidase-like regulatory domain-containing protein [Pirellulales bacterium]